MRKSLAAISFLLASTAAFAAAAPAVPELPVPRIETLPNGLTLAWFVSESLPVVDLALMVKSGYRDDPAGKAGTAELLASSLDRGAAGLSAQRLARAVEMLGASRYASADEDTFTVGMHGLAPDAATLLDLLAKVALRPDFPKEEVAREHARILDRWSHVPDYGESLVSLAYRRALTAGTSYGRGSFLSAREFASVGAGDARAFHKTHFTPKNAILMVVGRVDPEAFRKEALRLFGTREAWSGEAPKREWRKYADKRIPARRKGAVLLIHRPGLTQAQVRIGFPAPLINAPGHYPLTVANALLGEYFNSRLNALIRDQLGLTYGIGSSFAYSRDFADLTIGAATRNETVGPLVGRALEVLREMKKGPIPAEEVATAKEYLEGGFPLSTSTLGAVAARWLAGYIYGLGPDYLNEFIPKVREVTAAQVLAEVARSFRIEDAVIAVAGDAEAISKSLKEAKIGPVVRVDVKQLM